MLLRQDGKGNRIKQWNRPTLTSGVFNGELELSKSPVLGDWTIVALVENEQVEKKFLVAEYVLPKFEVTITTPEHVTFKEGKIVATVHARYYDFFLFLIFNVYILSVFYDNIISMNKDVKKIIIIIPTDTPMENLSKVR